ncbi:unnamed protein product [Periconia digitata]|uniref:Uncharacterized protein n=1 Tax=Periconia digitata TaxID=1303443 RepID=A0A9W4XN26_9PLEO|nr:unnamed protein product [Periconia digitata]
MPSTSLYYPILAIPAHQVFSFIIHTYAMRTLQSTGYRINRANPRAGVTPSATQGKVPDAIYQKYQRAKAAETNLVEYMPVFASAVLASVFANQATSGDLNAGGDVTGLTNFIATWYALRVAYVTAYIGTKNAKYATIRSIFWFLSLGLVGYQFYKVADVL